MAEHPLVAPTRLPAGTRILLTNNSIATWSGSELYVRDVALELVRRGHLPVVYSSVLGALADELRAATVPVISDLAELSQPPDLIHAHHHLDAITAMLWFPRTPAVYVTHGWAPWEELPPGYPNIRRYVAVSGTVRERLLTRGIGAELVDTVFNFADLRLFEPRPPLPEVPRRALVFTNHSREGDGYSTSLRDACRTIDVRVDLVGMGNGNAVRDPQRLLRDYDVVFAVGRSAIEAMAVGAAVVVAGPNGLAGMVDPDCFDRMRSLNFCGERLQTQPLSRDTIVAELHRYDPAGAAVVRDRIRTEATLPAAVNELEESYLAALAPGPVEVSTEERLRATARYLAGLAEELKHRRKLAFRAEAFRRDAALQGQRARQAEQRLARTRNSLAAATDALNAVRASRAHTLVSRLGQVRRRALRRQD